MGGFFGVAGKMDCVGDLFYGTDYHSHLGTKFGGLAVTGEDGVIFKRAHSISNAQFRSRFDAEIGLFKGNVGIGCISDFERQPVTVTGPLGTYAIVTVGKITNADKILKAAYEDNRTHFTECNENEVSQTELTAFLINQKNSIVAGLEYAQAAIEGSLSILVLKDNAIYAARDRYGRTPVIIGEKQDAFAVTMETTAFPNLNYNIKYDLGPGEIVRITPDAVIQERAPGERKRVCAFLWVYYGYPSSCYEGVNTEEVRYRNGDIMAHRIKPDVDLISGIPDSGIPHAIGFSNASGIPYKRAFVKYTPTWARSFMPQNQQMRNLVAQMKLIPVESQLKGKRILFCDDSIVRGTQMRETVVQLRELGVEEVHMCSASPPLLFGCKYLNFSRSRTELDLAARRAIQRIEKVDDLTMDIIKKYLDSESDAYKAMVEEVRKELGLNSLYYQTLPGLMEAIGLDPNDICTYCWNGRE